MKDASNIQSELDFGILLAAIIPIDVIGHALVCVFFYSALVAASPATVCT